MIRCALERNQALPDDRAVQNVRTYGEATRQGSRVHLRRRERSLADDQQENRDLGCTIRRNEVCKNQPFWRRISAPDKTPAPAAS